MARSLNLSLTDELRAFLRRELGPKARSLPRRASLSGALIREKKDRMEAAELRKAVLEGYDDVLHGRTLPLAGDLRSMIAEAKRRDEHGWD